MPRRIRIDGDTWQIGVEDRATQTGVRALVFHCVSNPQRPYRVVPAPDEIAEGSHDVRDDLSDDRLHEMFGRSQIMDFTRDADALPDGG